MNIALTNPIAWAHFHVRGGVRSLATACAGYAAVICGLIFLTLRVEPDPLATPVRLYYWTQGLMGLQMGLLILFGSGAIRTAVRKDFTTRMIESHRLMPVPAWEAIVGYVTGGGLQYVIIAVINLFIGCATSLGADLPLQQWVLANFIVGIFVLCLWFVSVLIAMVNPALFTLIVIALGSTVFSSAALVMAVPALAVLSGPMIGSSVFGIIEKGGEWDWPHQVSAAAQLAAAGVCFRGAIRKYKRDDLLAFEPTAALAILMGWIALNVLGMQYFSEFEFRLFGRRQYAGVDPQAQFVGSTVSAMLVAMLPVMAGVWVRVQWLARRARHDIALGDRPLPPEMIAISAAAFIALLGLSAGGEDWPYVAITTAGVALAFLLSVAYLLGIMYRVNSKPTLLVVLFVASVALLPLAIDGIRQGLDGASRLQMSWISTCSPLGALIAATTRGATSPLPGVLAQFGPAALLCFLYYRRGRRRSHMQLAQQAS